MNVPYITVFGMLFVLGLLALITILIVVVIWQSFTTRRARMSVEREEAYRRLAEQLTDAQQINAQEQHNLSKSVDEIQTRIAAIEKLLREVE
jgi:biopolymer transport protein ExbB/TolQ